MLSCVHDLLNQSALQRPKAIAVQIKDAAINYHDLQQQTHTIARAFKGLGLNAGDRVGIYLPKVIENIQALLACSYNNTIFVPINPVLKSPQVQHILNDCQIKVIITNKARFQAIKEILATNTSLKIIVLTDANKQELQAFIESNAIKQYLLTWQELLAQAGECTQLTNENSAKSKDTAAILYTSGSTGKAKGVMLSHNNLVLGTQSVAQYLKLTEQDKILAVLPLSFDYGLNQLLASLLVGGQCVLLDYLLANDVINAINKYQITGLAAVPPLWAQLAKATWSDASSIRYITNSGGVLDQFTLERLREYMPNAKPYLMYGLTEAFRSTYLEPSMLDKKQGSMGKAIPNAKILVLRQDGSECNDNEVGELVHLGPLVSQGYWQDEEQTKAKFKALATHHCQEQEHNIAVFSGDLVTRDSDGYLYFVSRADEMIKSSGYRISPTEIEEQLIKANYIDELVAFGVPHDELGQAIIVVASGNAAEKDKTELCAKLLKKAQINLPNYMLPKKIIILDELPKNANGKIDRSALKQRYQSILVNF